MKIYNYTLMTIGLITLMYIAGFDVASNWVITNLGLLNLANYQSFGFWTAIGGIFAITGLGTVAIGTLLNISPTYIIKALYVMTPLTLLLMDFISIMVKLNSLGVAWAYWVIAALMLPLIGAYSIALVEFWEGRD